MKTGALGTTGEREQGFFFSRNFEQVTLKIVYFYYLKIWIKESKKNISFNELKTEALRGRGAKHIARSGQRSANTSVILP